MKQEYRVYDFKENPKLSEAKIQNKDYQDTKPMSYRSKIILSMFGIMFVISILLISTNVSGNVIKGLDPNNYSLSGAILFLISIVGLFIHFKLKNKN